MSLTESCSPVPLLSYSPRHGAALEFLLGNITPVSYPSQVPYGEGTFKIN